MIVQARGFGKGRFTRSAGGGTILAKFEGEKTQDPSSGCCEEAPMHKATFLLSLMIGMLAVSAVPAGLSAAQPQDILTGNWVLKFEDGRTGWANLVYSDYAKTGFSSKGRIEVPGFKEVDLTSSVVPEYYREGQVILYNAQAQQRPFHFVRFFLGAKGAVTGYVATFDGKQYNFKAYRR